MSKTEHEAQEPTEASEGFTEFLTRLEALYLQYKKGENGRASV